MNKTVLGIMAVAAFLASSAWADAPPEIFVVTDYAFDRASNPGAPDVVNGLCATRCNALSADYQSYYKPGGWRLIKAESGKKLVVDLDNPFVKGTCSCTGDVYDVYKDIRCPDTVNKGAAAEKK